MRAALALFLILLAFACNGGLEEETPSPTPTSSPAVFEPSPVTSPTPSPTPSEEATATPVPPAPRIFFLSEREPSGAYLMDADGSGAVWIGGAAFERGFAVWSPDGSQVAVVRCPEDMTDKNSELIVVNADGSGEVNVSSHPDPDVVLCYSDAPIGGHNWAPDGSRLAFHSFRDPQGLYTVNADGSALAFLVDGALPSWSPDGEFIAFIGQTDDANWEADLEVIRPDGSGRTLLAKLPCEWGVHTGDACRPTQVHWSPDGTLFVFAVYPSRPVDEPPELGPDIYTLAADGTGLSNITGSPEADYRPVWVDCSRPTAGCQGEITNVAPDTLHVREEPTVGASGAGDLNEGDIVCLFGPSSFVDGYRWWPVRSEGGIEGFAAQADPANLGSPWITPTGGFCE